MHSDILEFRHPAEFANRGYGVVCFGSAPDGLPLVSRVVRPPSGAALLNFARQTLRMTSTEEQLAHTPLAEVATRLDELMQEHRYQEIETDDGDRVPTMLLWSSARSLTGRTVLERLLLTNQGGAFDAAPRYEATNAAALADKEGDEKFDQSRWRHVGEALVALRLDGGRPLIVREAKNRHGWPVYTFVQHFQEESLEPLGGKRVERGKREELDASDLRRYMELQRDMPSYDWHLQVERKRIGEVLADLAERLQEGHDDGRVHGDLKPANVLVTDEGPRPFDSLDLAEGTRSPAMTRGWAAPEQVLGREVSAATDQYPFGLILLRLVGGVLFGEEATVTVPTGGQGLERHSIHRNPGVYIDKQEGFVDRDSTAKWIRLIEKCVRFDDGDRHDSMKAIGEQLRFLAGTLQGELTLPLRFGNVVLAKPSSPDQWSGFVAEASWTSCWMVPND